MKFIKDNILFIAIVLLVLWLYFLVKPAYRKTPIDLSKYKKVLTIHDTIYSKAYINRYRKGDSIPYKVIDTLYTHISDTIRIISDCNQVKAYSDTIRKDSNIFVIDDTIGQNRIISRGFKASLTQKTIILREFYASKPTNTLYWGIRGSYSPINGLEVLSPSLMLSVKNKALIGLSVDISKNYNIGYSGGIYLKIGK
jgi:hypothetical protein